jgi:glucose/arabinose dehydrogenase
MKHLLLLIASLFSIGSYAQSIGVTLFKSGFTSPVEIVHPPNDARLFVVQQGGAIRILNPNATINATPFLTIPSGSLSNGDEQGLLGLAFHPDYATNGIFFVNYTRADGATVVARYTVSANPDIANPTGTPILTIPQPYSNHNGGTLRFGADGYLYVGMGDGGLGGDPGNRAQNINENLGKMLRLNIDVAGTYAIPADNPYVGVAGNDEIWSVGLRNPWKFSFNRLTGDMWLADVGQGSIEEINKVNPATANLNYGWKCYEGNNVYTAGCAVPTTTYTFPVTTYGHSNGRCSVTGGYVYTGAITTLLNKYIFADYCSAEIGYIDASGTSSTITWTGGLGLSSVTTLGEDKDGEMYIATRGGSIYKITDPTFSTATFGKTSMQLYPNPATSEVFIKAENMSFPAEVEIFDISGKQLSTQYLTSGTNRVSTGDLQSGIYLVTVTDNSGANFKSKLTVQ